MIDRIHGGNVYAYLKGKDSYCKKDFIDFSININPLGLVKEAKQAIKKNIDSILCYPEPESKDLKKSLASWHNLGPDNILVGNGSVEFIYLIPRALNVKTVLILCPAFSEYEFSAKSAGARIVFLKALERDNFKIDVCRLKKFIPGTDLVFLCNPNNPTGFLMPHDEILDLSQFCARRRVAMVVDEAFMDFVDRSLEPSLLSQVKENRFILVLRSLTKFFALPGLRLGYLLGHRDLLFKISQSQYPWNVNLLAQIAGERVIKDSDYIRRTKMLISQQRRYLFINLSRLKALKVFSPAANFIFCKLEKCHLRSARALNEILLKQGIAIRPCYNFRGLNDRFFRVAVRTKRENIKLINSLSEILNG